MIITIEKPVSGMYASKSKITKLDTIDLDEQQQKSLQNMINEIDFFNLPQSLSNSSSSSSADFNSYQITIEDKDSKKTVIRTNFSIDSKLSDLVKLVTSYAQNK
jgi:hypothetical protein